MVAHYFKYFSSHVCAKHCSKLWEHSSKQDWESLLLEGAYLLVRREGKFYIYNQTDQNPSDNRLVLGKKMARKWDWRMEKDEGKIVISIGGAARSPLERWLKTKDLDDRDSGSGLQRNIPGRENQMPRRKTSDELIGVIPGKEDQCIEEGCRARA